MNITTKIVLTYLAEFWILDDYWELFVKMDKHLQITCPLWVRYVKWYTTKIVHCDRLTGMFLYSH